MEQGVSEKEALKAALSQWGTGILGDAIGGFLSGSVMSGGKEYANARTNPLYQWNMPMSAARALNDIERSGLRRDRGNAEMTPPLPGSMQRNAQGEVTPNVETAGQEGLRYSILEGGDEQGKNDALNAAYQKANTAERSVEISKKLLDKYREISNNPLQKLVNVVKEFYDQNLKGRKATVNVNGRTLEISFENDGKKKSVGWRMNTDKAASFEKLYELTQNAEYAYSERNRDPNEATSVPIFHYFVGNIRMANETGNYQNVPVKIQVRDVVTSADEKETHYYTHNLDRRIAGSDSPVAGAQSPNIDSNAYTPAIERNVSQFVSSVNTPPLPTGRITTQKKRGRTAYQAYLDRYDEAVSLRLTAGPAERDTVWTRYLRRQEEELRAKALKTVEILGYVPEEYAGLLDEEPGTPSLAALAHHQNQRRNSDAEEHLHSESEEESVDKSGEDSIINHEPNIVNKVDTGKHRNENALTKSQLHEAIKWARKHGYNCDIEYSDYCSTAFIGYSDGACLLVIVTDALPSDAPRTANEAISLHGAIVHEVVGHYEAWLKGTSKSNEALEEAQASIRAAKFGLDLSEYERTLLYEDAMDRLANAGISFEKVKDQLDIWER